MSFWENVDFIRESKGISRKELATLANFSLSSFSTGISRGSYPAVDVAYRIAKTLDVSVEFLLTGKNERKTSENDSEAISECAKKYLQYKSLIEDLEVLPEQTQSSIKNMIRSVSSII